MRIPTLFFMAVLLQLCMLLGFSLAAAARPQGAATVHQVQGEMLQLSHLFGNAVTGPDRAIGPAPDPGRSLVLSPRQLERIAQRHNVAWTPGPNAGPAVIRRSATPAALKPDALAALLSSALGQPDRTAPPPAPIPVVAVDTVPVPMPVRRIQRGESIDPSDLVWRDMPSDEVEARWTVDMADLAGKAARRSLQPERPIRRSDLREAFLVEKGQAITLTVARPGISVTAKGKALESGARDATIRVVNTASQQIVDAIVTGSQRAMVSAN